MRSGENTIRLEHESRFPYFEKILIAKYRLRADGEIPRTVAQIARQYGVNAGFLEQWVERLNRAKGAPASIFFAWFAYGDNREGWATPAANTFGGARYTSREEAAARYQELFNEAVREWSELHPESALNYTNKERYKDDQEEPTLPDPGLEAFRKVLYEKYGPFRPPNGIRKYYSQGAKDALAKLEAERKELETATPEFPRAMGSILAPAWPPGTPLAVSPKGSLFVTPSINTWL